MLNASADSLLITRKWAILAGENDYTTGAFAQITGRPRARSPSSSTSTARTSPDPRASPTTAPAAVAQLMVTWLRSNDTGQ